MNQKGRMGQIIGCFQTFKKLKVLKEQNASIWENGLFAGYVDFFKTLKSEIESAAKYDLEELTVEYTNKHRPIVFKSSGIDYFNTQGEVVKSSGFEIVVTRTPVGSILVKAIPYDHELNQEVESIELYSNLIGFGFEQIAQSVLDAMNKIMFSFPLKG
jgi:hypothetical protein